MLTGNEKVEALGLGLLKVDDGDVEAVRGGELAGLSLEVVGVGDV